MEARGFRVAYPDIQRLNGEVIGVSPDSKETLARYAAEKELPFLFAPDPSKDLARGWGITRRLTGGIKRITVVIAPGGRVHRVIQHDLRIHLHVRESLEALEELANNE